MSLTIATITVDCRDAVALARFWNEALGFEMIWEYPEADPTTEVLIGEKGDAGHKILFGEVPETKGVKNRWHLDLRPDHQAAEVARLKGLGATEVDVGQGPEVTWVVMADPEGNEFCILRALRPDESGP